MSPVAVQVNQVSKRFTLHRERHRSFQEYAVNAFRGSRTKEEFWALRDVSFQVDQGRSFGIIGENGSGKSTTLKLVTGILRPTSGTVRVEGRMAALLENPAIVRNRLKIASAIGNARAFEAVRKEFGSFDAFVWRFVDGAPKVNDWKAMKQVPARTEISDALSKELTRRGF